MIAYNVDFPTPALVTAEQKTRDSLTPYQLPPIFFLNEQRSDEDGTKYAKISTERAIERYPPGLG
jgi:hypothetical protein